MRKNIQHVIGWIKNLYFAVLRWFSTHQLVTLILFLFVGELIFEYSPNKNDLIVDPYLVLYISLTYSFCILVMLLYTRRWNTIGIGLLATMCGNALLYYRIYFSLMGNNVLAGDHVSDTIRSCYLVGSTYLVIGVVGWVRDDKHLRDEAGRIVIERQKRNLPTEPPAQRGIQQPDILNRDQT